MSEGGLACGPGSAYGRGVNSALPARLHTATVAGAAVVRLAFAAWFVMRPDAPARVLGRPPSPRSRRVTLLVALREAILGVGTAVALLRGRPTAGWVMGMAVADAVNGTSTAVAGLRGRVAPRRAVALAAFDLSGTVSEVFLARGSHHGQQGRRAWEPGAP